ncbi:hypothetical protein Droror1_Dr00008439 [Drosera rotundifolia]
MGKTREMLGYTERETLVNQFREKNKPPPKRRRTPAAKRPKLIPSGPTIRYRLNLARRKTELGIVDQWNDYEMEKLAQIQRKEAVKKKRLAVAYILFNGH